MRSTAAPYTESRLTRSVANERVGFPVVEHFLFSSISKISLFLAVYKSRFSVSYKVVLLSRVQEGPMKKTVEGKILLVSIIEYEVRSPKFIWAPYGQLSFYYRIYAVRDPGFVAWPKRYPVLD